MLGACVCVSLCVFCCQPLIGRFFVCLPGIIDGVCVCVFYLSGCLSLCLVLLVSVDLLVLSSSTCTAGCHTCLGGEKKALTLIDFMSLSMTAHDESLHIVYDDDDDDHCRHRHQAH